MHYTALSALLMRHHNSPKIQDLLRRVNKEILIGTVSYSDPATGECCLAGNVLNTDLTVFFGNSENPSEN